LLKKVLINKLLKKTKTTQNLLISIRYLIGFGGIIISNSSNKQNKL
jgi:hypothetical protein